MPYSDHYEQLDYHKLWYADNWDEHIKKRQIIITKIGKNYQSLIGLDWIDI